MRAVIQRVSHASCTVNGKRTGAINQGLLIFLGVEEQDDSSEINWLANKIVNMRIFSDEQGLMNKSVLELNGDILLISQFTLFAQTKKGNRPSFIRAAKPLFAKKMYEEMTATLNKLLDKNVQLGIFGADMQIDLKNDGPVTIIMDSKDRNNF
ncbi:D-tyrosyl-tRNA(Tyr) deacylase [Sphingobacterium shayense]|uniref:D-aminoacyl-tRNA deacylase n=1 Tax=Sphingobacterium shayense TaxID=626343 RepID=UPI0015547BF1|nr:D-aminoacyl-tRNA deacylase [Sphingobacterium shayense]NQD71824.1 D-tyrosyl-tRNA(Tyr) deacylase [Sphingobacterium shayense]